MSAATYTDRRIDVAAIKSLGDGVIHRADGWSQGATADVIAQLEVGQEYGFESQGFNTISGIQNPRTGYWFFRKSDQDLEREHAEVVAKIKADREKQLAANKDKWLAREAQLPLSLRRRLARFRANGGHEFETDGWGYELVVCELAVLYAASGGEDDEAVTQFARSQGTSGNQHGYAKALAKHVNSGDPSDEDAVANSVSALTPLTGDHDYSGSKATA